VESYWFAWPTVDLAIVRILAAVSQYYLLTRGFQAARPTGSLRRALAPVLASPFTWPFVLDRRRRFFRSSLVTVIAGICGLVGLDPPQFDGSPSAT
jgi:hypothetical protein